MTWTAPRSHGPVRAVVAVPGSKSETNRALLLAAIADGPSRIEGALVARDTELMVAALRALGVGVDHAGGVHAVTPFRMRGPARVDCGLAGTVMRFVPAIAALAEGPVTFDGDARARERPMGPVVDALRQLGVRVDDDGRGALPFTVHGTGAVAGGEVHIDASASSQFVSALLLAGARYDAGVMVRHRGAPVPSMPHLEMTVAMLRDRGVRVEADTADPAAASWTVHPGPIAAITAVIEPDLSNAVPFLAAAAATGGEVTVPGWPRTTTQAGDAARALLAAMGCRVRLAADGLTVTGPAAGGLLGLTADLHDVGELTPVFAALCALASTPSRLSGIAHLRGHETDRLAALEADLRGLGARARQTDDGLVVEPAALHGGPWRSHDDHRMATAGAVVGLVVDGVVVDDITTTSKTLPDFVGMWERMLGSRVA